MPLKFSTFENKTKVGIKKVHYLSGLTISIFITLHLFNHLTGILGAEMHITVMNKLRIIYRNPIAETILLIAVFVQIISGIKLYLTKRKSNNNFNEQLQIWSGLYLAFFLLIHVSAVLGGRYVLNLNTNYYFGVAGLNAFPFNLFFIPYYSLAIIAFFAHVASIHAKKMKQVVFGFTALQQSKLILLIGVILTIFILYGLTNGFKGVEIPETYKVLIGQ